MLKQNGFSLIELMVSIIIGLFSLTAILTILSNNLAFSRSSIDMLRLNQEMRIAMDTIADDLRRAGYWNNTQSMVNNLTVSNPHSFPNLPVTINNDKDCIVFSYDRDNSSDTPAANEIFGFALKNNQIVTGFPEDIDGCDSISDWKPLTDSKIVKIESLSFESINPTTTQNPTGTSTDVHQLISTAGLVCIREIRIRISATLVKNDLNNPVKQSLEKTIRLRNDEIRRSPATSCA
ncbi:prepilin-type N-terminal cleavage/methylation domain-containing protein [Chitinibacter sp. FCG-7]|uniref:Prepilin-type N-terminal cleavage/methylation domain-containing protein n=1 Tax=Chitinibacter mangrovi TaxID=3153927 RepID=A0AAU7FFG6_9NEIS